MKRYLQDLVQRDSDDKVILISGPRQCGKTTLSKALFKNYVYLNYDFSDDREAIANKHWSREADCVIFDELHKMPNWKRWLKGIVDTEGNRPRLIVTGSANMDAFAKVGDSLAGRYFQFRLHPIDIKEGVEFVSQPAETVAKNILTLSGFPEPFLKDSEVFYRRWRRTHLDVILRQDFLDLTAVRAIKNIEVLIDLITQRIASPLSYANLAQDLQVDAKTIKAWTLLLENFYVLFKVTPYHHNIARAILKEPKFYFFDVPRVKEEGARIENLVACALLKAIHHLEDTEGLNGRLHYLRTRDNQEIDFLVVVDEKPVFCCEVKTSDTTPSKHFEFFQQSLKLPHAYQLVFNCSKEFDTATGVRVRDLVKFLERFSLRNYV
jgi:predicted AAA+ superfamily ATPase